MPIASLRNCAIRDLHSYLITIVQNLFNIFLPKFGTRKNLLDCENESGANHSKEIDSYGSVLAISAFEEIG